MSDKDKTRSTVRLFIAVNFPNATRDRLWQTTAPLRDAGYPVRWVRADRLHLTVKFLGGVSPGRAEEIGEALRGVVTGTRSFRLPMGGFGAFPNTKQPKVVWVGCEGIPVLELLQDGVERRMDTLGFPVEGRPFRPHVTIGRVERNAKPARLAGLDSALNALEFFEEPSVESVDLMRSHLGREGPRYERLVAAELVG